MSEEKALKRFATCYNAGDFTGIIRLLHQKVTYEAFNRFYVNSGKESVARLLEEKAAELRALSQPNRAYNGFIIVKHDIIGRRAEPCLVLTKADPWQVEGVVRIRCTPLRIKRIRVLNPAECQYTRGEYADGKG